MYTKYLVTGATGFLGRAVVGELAKSNAAIVALVLPGDGLKGELPAGTVAVEGDVCDLSSLAPFFAGAGADTCVIHCAGIVSVASDPGQKIFDVNVGGTRNILHMCAAQKVGKLVYVSSVHALPEKPKGTCMAETYDFSPDLVQGGYAKSKAQATAAVLKAAEEGLNASVVLPSGIIGPGDSCGGSITSMLVSFLRGHLPLAVKGGYDFVDVRDVAKGIVACAEKGERGRCYILSGHYTTIRQMLETVKKIVKSRRPVSYLPIALAKRIAPLYEKHSLRRKKPLYFTPYSVAVLDANGSFSHGAANAAFGYAPRTLESTLRDTVAWLGRLVKPARDRKKNK